MANKGKGASKGATADGRKLICQNRRASRNYELGDKYEAGVVLTGTEVKSCRAGKAHLNDAYVQIERGEAYLLNAHIAEYAQGSHFNHEPERKRKMLMHRNEIDKLDVKIRERGFSAIPVALYFKGGYVKVEFALGRGRTSIDKREHVKKREANREMERALRRGGR